MTRISAWDAQAYLEAMAELDDPDLTQATARQMLERKAGGAAPAIPRKEKRRRAEIIGSAEPHARTRRRFGLE